MVTIVMMLTAELHFVVFSICLFTSKFTACVPGPAAAAKDAAEFDALAASPNRRVYFDTVVAQSCRVKVDVD